jgi:hypothetical protein
MEWLYLTFQSNGQAFLSMIGISISSFYVNLNSTVGAEKPILELPAQLAARWEA